MALPAGHVQAGDGSAIGPTLTLSSTATVSKQQPPEKRRVLVSRGGGRDGGDVTGRPAAARSTSEHRPSGRYGLSGRGDGATDSGESPPGGLWGQVLRDDRADDAQDAADHHARADPDGVQADGQQPASSSSGRGSTTVPTSPDQPSRTRTTTSATRSRPLDCGRGCGSPPLPSLPRRWKANGTRTSSSAHVEGNRSPHGGTQDRTAAPAVPGGTGRAVALTSAGGVTYVVVSSCASSGTPPPAQSRPGSGRAPPTVTSTRYLLTPLVRGATIWTGRVVNARRPGAVVSSPARAFPSGSFTAPGRRGSCVGGATSTARNVSSWRASAA